jgi:hypothetical protein
MAASASISTRVPRRENPAICRYSPAIRVTTPGGVGGLVGAFAGLLERGGGAGSVVGPGGVSYAGGEGVLPVVGVAERGAEADETQRYLDGSESTGCEDLGRGVGARVPSGEGRVVPGQGTTADLLEVVPDESAGCAEEVAGVDISMDHVGGGAGSVDEVVDLVE